MTVRSTTLRVVPGRITLAAALLLTTATAMTAATPSAGAAGIASLSCAAAPAGPAPASPSLTSFTPIAPTRLVDTRDGTGGVGVTVGAGCTLRVDVGGTVPAAAEAVALSVTAISATAGFLSVGPCSSGRLPTSNVNTRAGFPTPNLAVALPDDDDLVCIYTETAAELLVDLTGYWTTSGSSRFVSVEPDRVSDSRVPAGSPKVAANAVHTIDLSGDVPAGTTAVVGNLTIASPNANGFAAAYPCGTSVPATSNVNFRSGEARASAILVGIDGARRLCVTTSVDAHVIFDLTGYYQTDAFGPIASMRPESGTRVADSRDGTGGWNGAFGAGTVRRVRPLAGRSGAAQATAVVLNVIALRAQSNGFVEVYPCDSDDPETSSVNYTTAGATSNLVVVELSTSGEVCVSPSTSTDVVVDLFGTLSVPNDALFERMSLGETWPPYSPSQSDYAARCGSGNATLELDLLSGTTATVNGVPVQAGDIGLVRGEGDLVTVRLTRSGTTLTHHFRCVPADFPRFDVERSGTAAAGWYLTIGYVDGAANAYAMIMDGAGAPVWYGVAPPRAIEFRRRGDGLLVHVPSMGPRYGVDLDAAYQVITLAGAVVDEIATAPDPGTPGPDPTDHHDMVELPGGRAALFTYTLESGVNLSAIGFAANDTIAENVIQEVGPDGDLEWSWQFRDHFDVREATFAQRFPPAPGYPGGEVDVWHANSIDVQPDGDYVVSARHMDAVFRIDRATGDVQWILGSEYPVANPDGADQLTIVGDPLGGPRRQHDARLDGNVLTMLDNRTGTGQAARAVAYQIDTGAGTATMLWSITTSSGVSSNGLGSNRQTFDGNTLVSWGNGPTPLFEEFSPGRQSVLRFSQDGGYSYRITKEPLSAFSAPLLRATAGVTIG